MHRTKRVRFQTRWLRQVKVSDHKTAVFGMVERGGKVKAKVINNVRAKDVMPIIQENVEPNAEVFTDQSVIYRDFTKSICTKR